MASKLNSLYVIMPAFSQACTFSAFCRDSHLLHNLLIFAFVDCWEVIFWREQFQTASRISLTWSNCMYSSSRIHHLGDSDLVHTNPLWSAIWVPICWQGRFLKVLALFVASPFCMLSFFCSSSYPTHLVHLISSLLQNPPTKFADWNNSAGYWQSFQASLSVGCVSCSVHFVRLDSLSHFQP